MAAVTGTQDDFMLADEERQTVFKCQCEISPNSNIAVAAHPGDDPFVSKLMRSEVHVAPLSLNASSK